MKNHKEKPMRMDVDFVKELEDIKLARINLGKESVSKPNGLRRYTKSIIRHDLWKKMKKDISLADLEDDRGVIYKRGLKI